MAKHESVEDYLARGGKIQVIPRGVGKEQIKMVRSKVSKDRVTYARGGTRSFNGKRREGE